MARFEEVLPGQFIDVERVIGIGVSSRLSEGEEDAAPGFGVGIIWETVPGVSPILMSPTFETEDEARAEAYRIRDMVSPPVFRSIYHDDDGVMHIIREECSGGYYTGEGYNPGLPDTYGLTD